MSSSSPPLDGTKKTALAEMDRNAVRVFISHRHEDEDFATAILEALLQWGFTRERVFCSSQPGSGVSPGEFLTEEIKSFLFGCNVVFYLYTTTEKNWEWTSYEVGVAEDPNVPTKVITLALVEGHEPKIQKGRLVVHVTRDSIRDLIKQLFEKDGFIPGYKAYWPEYDTKVRTEQADTLFKRLNGLRDRFQGQVDFRPEPRWGWFTLRLDSETRRVCEDLWHKGREEESDQTREIQDVLANHLTVVEAAGWGLYHFGYSNSDRAVRDAPQLRQLESQWRETCTGSRGNEDWPRELVAEIWNCCRNRGSELSWRPFRSANPLSESPGLVYPIVTRIYRDQDGGRRYDVHMFLMPSPIAEPPIEHGSE